LICLIEEWFDKEAFKVTKSLFDAADAAETLHVNQEVFETRLDIAGEKKLRVRP
jgi:hypothetical protein